MLNEKQIEALNNGVYGITRDGRKALYIGKEQEGYTWLIFSVSNPNLPDELYPNYDTFNQYWNDEEYSNDIVGLWEDRPEPFNLERALAGEPVRLVNGKKAFVLKKLTNTYGDWLLGYIDYGTYQVVCDWGVTGGVDLTTHEEDFSIAGIWKNSDE